ncbi:MAG: HEPN domain-containing protein [Patescibacteria group bacterium]
MKAESKVWKNLADEDFKNAELLWENHRYGATVFFYQQAVEKILKAYIIEHKSKLPAKTHRIEVLLQEAEISLSDIGNPKIEELSKAYIRVRYPDLNKQYYRRRDQVTPLITMAKTVYLWVKNIQTLIRAFAKRAKTTLGARRVILFGSYANNTATEYSDIDVVVVSDTFKTMSQKKRLDSLYRISSDLQPDIHPFGLTTEEYTALSPLISISEVKKTGIDIL